MNLVRLNGVMSTKDIKDIELCELGNRIKERAVEGPIGQTADVTLLEMQKDKYLIRTYRSLSKWALQAMYQ